MLYTITTSMIEKLSHHIEEIRVRTLKDITQKISKAFLNDAEIDFNGPILLKALIRWFGHHPVCEEKNVLMLMSIVLKSKYASDILKYLGVERIETEINKIQVLLKNPEHLDLLSEIRTIINSNKNGNKKESSIADKDKLLNDFVGDIHIDLTDLNESLGDLDITSMDYVQCWDIAGQPDLNSLKLLKQSLHSTSEEDNLYHAISYCSTAIADYPAEFFLQPPYVYSNILKLVENNNDVFDVISKLNQSLIGRIKFRQMIKTYMWANSDCIENKYNQVSITKYCKDCFRALFEWLKNIPSDRHQIEINICFRLMVQLVQLAKLDPTTDVLAYDDILSDLGYLAKFYRQTNESSRHNGAINHKLYILVLNMIMKLVERRNYKDNFTMQLKSKKVNFPTKHYDPLNFHSPSSNWSDYETNVEMKNWMQEIIFALLDVAIKNLYPILFNAILTSVKWKKLTKAKEIETILECDNILKPAVELIRQPRNISDEILISKGLEAIKTMSMHQSIGLVRLLINSISNSLPYFDGNSKLKENGEMLLLKLISHSNSKIKRIVYQLCGEKMKHFFSSLVDGETMLAKCYSLNMNKGQSLGIPLTVEILTEIVCFGYGHEDPVIHSNAESILTFIIKGRKILGKYWNNILEILTPILPLLQCWASKSSTLGQAIFDFLDPDNDLQSLHTVQGNIRFLFSEDPTIRDEALSRLLYIVDQHPQSSSYVPNINHISDTLPNNICILEHQIDVEKRFNSDLYEVNDVYPLLELLKNHDIDPSIRRTTLMQLNVMALDPKINQIIHDENGWFLILSALDSSLKVNHAIDYPDSAMPAVGIFTKLCLQILKFRREMSKELNLYFLLLRTLFMYHNYVTSKPDCTIALFLLSYNDYIVGSKEISLPFIFSKLKLPFVATYRWHDSPFHELSELELIFENLKESTRCYSSGSKNLGENGMEINRPRSILSMRCTSECSTSRYQQQFQSKSDHYSIPLNTQSPRIDDLSGNFETALNQATLWQYLRLSFANVWFDGYENIMKNAKACKKNKDDEDYLDYALLPIHLYDVIDGETVDLEDILDFDQQLKLTKQDLFAIYTSSSLNSFQNYIKKIQNATMHSDVLEAVGQIENILIIRSNVNAPMDNLISNLKRFCLSPPSTDVDENLLLHIIRLLGNIISDENNSKIIYWLLKEFQEKHCIFIDLIFSENCSQKLFNENVNFVKKFLTICLMSNHAQIIFHKEMISEKKGHESEIIFNRLFHIVYTQLEEKMTSKSNAQLDTICNLISLLRIISSSGMVDIDEEYTTKISNKLLYFASATKSLCQAGSNFIKSCLLTIGHLMKQINELTIKSKFIKFLSGLCGHTDLEIRAISWSLLSKIAKSLNGAHLLIKELMFLPGGFHACCISSVLDVHEVAVVREAAAGLFANLISHIVAGRQLHMSVAPICHEMDSSLDNENAIGLLIKILNKQRVFQRMSECLQFFTASDIVDLDENNRLTSCNVVKSYCIILIKLIDLRPEIVNELYDNCLAIEFANILSHIPTNPTKSSILMGAEICNFLIRCFRINNDIIKKITAQNHATIAALIFLLNYDHYQDFQNTPIWKSIVTFLQIVRILGNTKPGFQIICNILNQEESSISLFELLKKGLELEELIDVQIACMNFVTSFLLMDQSNNWDFSSFLQLMEKDQPVNIFEKGENRKGTNSKKKLLEKFKRMSNNLENVDPNRMKARSYKKLSLDDQPLDKSEIISSASTTICFLLCRSFDQICIKDKPKQGCVSVTAIKIACCGALQVILKCSLAARQVANKLGLLTKIINRFECIFTGLGLCCSDFIRRYGDSKKDAIISELSILTGIISGWFINDCLIEASQIEPICCVILKLWPWANKSHELQLEFMKVLIFLSEDSIPVCKAIASSVPGISHKIIELVISIVTQETTKVKYPQTELALLKMALRVLINCCACIEGRLQLGKLKVLDNISRLHPAVTKEQKPWNHVTLMWLTFWEVYSRYPEGAVIRHLSLLCAIINRGRYIPIRLEALKILRNMSFLSSNRPALLASDEYLGTLKQVLDGKNFDEHLLCAVSIWKLIANNYKAKTLIKNSSIPRKFICIQKCLALQDNCEDNELFVVLDIIGKILTD